MKRIDWRRAALLAAPGGLLAAFAFGGGSWLWATLDPAERDTLAAVLHSRGMLLVMVGLALWALAAWGLERLYRQHVTAAAQLLEQARSRTGEQVAMALEPAGSPPLRGLAEVLNTLVQQRSDLHGQMAAKVAEAAALGRRAVESVEAYRRQHDELPAKLVEAGFIPTPPLHVYGIEMDGPAMVVTIRQGAGFPDGGRLIWELTESADGKTAWRCRAQRLPAPTLPEDCR